MHAMNRRIGTLTAAAIVVLVTGMSAAATRPPVRDELYRGAQLDSHRTITIAVLPVVGVARDPRAERQVEAAWVGLYQPSTTRWMPADEVRARLSEATVEPGNLASEVDEQIWRCGEVEPWMAGRLAGLLGVHAVLSVRIDRWEIADGGRGVVGMTASLTDADGTRLWWISGAAGHGLPPASAEQNFEADGSAFWNAALEWRENDHNLERALRTLLARWAWSLPAPLYGDEEPATPMLAGGDPAARNGAAAGGSLQ